MLRRPLFLGEGQSIGKEPCALEDTGGRSILPREWKNDDDNDDNYYYDEKTQA